MNDDIRLQEDTAARLEALEVRSFIVEAPAGAGKTELLTQRYLRLLAVVQHPEEVLALTFTNKAATEMRDRILGSLTLAATGEMPEQAHKQQTFTLARTVLAHDAASGWGLQAHPGRLRITTLDALCASLARQMPYLSRFGAQPGVAEEARPHYETAARRTLEMLENGDAAADVVAEALHFMDNDAGRLERLLVAMLARRDQWLQHLGRLDSQDLRVEVEAGFSALIERDIEAAASQVDARLQSLLMGPVRFAADNVPDLLAPLQDWTQPLSADLSHRAAWQALAGLLLTTTGTLRSSYNVKVGFPAGEAGKPFKEAMGEAVKCLAAIPGIEKTLAQLQQLPPAELSDQEWSTVQCFAQLLKLAAGQLWLAFQEAGEVDFIEIAFRASLALGDEEAPTDLAQALDYRIRHLLVDEFQDTSPVQVDLIEKLTRGWTPDDGRTLFVVGDPMQSIYRFRKADVGLFLRVRAAGIGDIRLENLRLCRNNRSYPGIVDWVNQAFPQIFPATDSPETGAVRYAESVATKALTVESGVSVHPVFASKNNNAGAEEARQVLNIIRQTQAERPKERIAVLVRARAHLDALVAEIRRSAPELRFQAVDIEGLDGRQAIQDLLILQQALWHRADRVNWLAMLRAPWCGLTLADLHALAANDKNRTVWQLMHDEARLCRLSADGQTRLQHVKNVLGLVFAGQGRQHPRRWLESAWMLLGGPATLTAATDLADVEAFFRLMDQLTAAGQLNAAMLKTKMEKLFAPPDPLAGETLQMMTIHKAKGLEFETVILPGLHRQTAGNDSRLLVWDEVADTNGHEHLLVAPMRAKGAKDSGVTACDYLKKLEAKRTAHESVRLLYVAATRAIRHLHLVGVVALAPEKPEGMKTPANDSLLNLLWTPVAQRVFAEALPIGNDNEALTEPDTRIFIPKLWRLRQPEIPEILRSTPQTEAFSNETNAPDNLPDMSISRESCVGTLVHRYLELIAKQGLSHWPPERLDPLRPTCERWLTQQGLAPEVATEAAGDVLAALQTTLNSVAGRWILSSHEEAAAEQGWSSRAGNVAVNHVIDRIFIADGCRWIIDYKTVQAGGESIKDLRQQAEKYRPQLERYAGLFVADQLPTRMAVFFAVQGELVELTE